MIKVDTSSLEKCLNLSVIARTFVEGVSTCVIFKGLTSNNELRIGHKFERVWTRLKKSQNNEVKIEKMVTKSAISRKCTSTLHSSRSGKFAEMWMSGRGSALPHLRGTVSEFNPQ